MIGLLRGERIETWHQGSRQGVLIACGGVGYEVQITKKHLLRLESSKEITLWIHQLQRDESCFLFGFLNKEERNFFRLLIGINGVGPQVALALIETAETQELINAILESDIPKLTEAQGVGKRTAERISMELRPKLNSLYTQQSQTNTLEHPLKLLGKETFNDLESTLIALGYEETEIRQAINSVTSISTKETNKNVLPTNFKDDSESLLRSTLQWLSDQAA